MQIRNQNVINAAAFSGNEAENGIRVATATNDRETGVRTSKTADSPGGSISASSLRLGENSIESRKQLARKQVMKIVGDAFAHEKGMDQSLKDIDDNMHRLNKDLAERKQKVSENNEKLAELRAEYGIEEGSQEDLELKKAAMKANSKDGMSSEEYDKLSEFQQRALYYVADNQTQTMEIDRDKSLLAANVQSRTDLELARLKDHSMINAQKEAEAIMDAATEDAISMLTQEAVDHIDEEAEEAKEAAEKKAEEEKEEKKADAKKAEEQAKVDELNARIRENGEAEAAEAAARGRAARQERENAGSEEITDTAVQFDIQSISDGTANVEVAGEVKNILNKLSLLSEDIKGASVDDLL